MMRTALIYARQSKSRAGSLSVDEQITEAQRWCEGNGLTVAQVVRDEGRSASRYAKGDRDGWREVLAAIEGRVVDVVVTWEASRSTRDLSAYTELRTACERAGVLWAYSGRVHDLSRSDDRFTTGLDVLLSEREVDSTRDRILRRVRASAERGTPHGRLPYGYRRDYDVTPSGEKVLHAQVPHEPEAQVLREAADRILNGESLRQICRDLDARGVPVPRKPRDGGAPAPAWTTAMLRQRLLQPTIAGLRQHQGKIVGDAAWKPIIPEQTWRDVRAVLTASGRRPVSPRGPEARHLLSNIARCGECDQPLAANPNRHRSPAYMCRTEGCRAISVSEAALDRTVETRLLDWLTQPDTLDRMASAAARRRAAGAQSIAQTADELHTLRSSLDEAADEYAAGGISAAMLAKVETRLNDRISELESARNRQVAPSPDVAAMLSASDLRGAWDAASLQVRRRILRALCTVHVNRTDKRGRTFDDDRVVIDLGRPDSPRDDGRRVAA